MEIVNSFIYENYTNSYEELQRAYKILNSLCESSHVCLAEGNSLSVECVNTVQTYDYVSLLRRRRLLVAAAGDGCVYADVCGKGVTGSKVWWRLRRDVNGGDIRAGNAGRRWRPQTRRYQKHSPSRRCRQRERGRAVVRVDRQRGPAVGGAGAAAGDAVTRRATGSAADAVSAVGIHLVGRARLCRTVGLRVSPS